MKRLFWMSCFLLLVSAVLAGKAYRDFTDAQGRTIRGCVIAYESAKQMVTFERENHKPAKVPLHIFSDADQAYISNWGAAQAFESKRNFKISAQKRSENNKAASNRLSGRNPVMVYKVEDTHYEILLENRSASMLTDLRVEYCIYYKQDHAGGEGNRTLCGRFELDQSQPKSKASLATDAVSIYQSELSSGYIYAGAESSIHTGEIDGIWIRVYVTIGDKECLREYLYPDDLSRGRVWKSESSPPGIND